MKPRALDWAAITTPVVSLRGPAGDGIELHVTSRTVPERSYNGMHFALGQVTTIAGGVREQHDNVLLSTREPELLADLLMRALSENPGRTLSVFDDSMTINLQREEAERWTVTCRPIPLPSPDREARLLHATWRSFPEFSFGVGRAEVERALKQLVHLGERLEDDPG